MKKLVLASILLAGSTLAHAEKPSLVSADGSELSALCLAAVESRADLFDTAREFGINPVEPETLRCNGMTLSRFVKTYRTVEATAAAPVTKKPAGYYFTKTDNSETTNLCLAAVSSEQEYQRLKDVHFSGIANVETVVLCNGKPLKEFARRYAAPSRALTLR